MKSTSFYLDTTKATSGYYDGRYLYLTCTQEKDVAKNQSKVKWTLTSVGGTVNYYDTGATYVWIGDRRVFARERVYYSVNGDTRFPASRGSVSGEEIFDNEADGSLKLLCKIQTAIFQGEWNSGTSQQYWELEDTPRAAQLTSAPNFYDEENPTIIYNNPAGEVVDSVQAAIFNADGSQSIVGYREIPKTGSSYTFELTDEERERLIATIPSGKDNVYVRFYIKTYINGEIVEEPRQLTRILTIINADPDIDPTARDIGAASTQLTGNDQTIIKGFNCIHAGMSLTLKKGATTVKQTITNGGTIIDGMSANFNNVDNGIFTYSLTDSFGHTITKTLELDVIPYIKLTCNVRAQKPTADGDMVFRISGNYFNDSFGAVDNTLTVKWRIKENDNDYSDWIPVDCIPGTDNYSVTINLTDLNYKSTYTIQAMASDKINSEVLSAVQKVKAIPVYNWGENNFDVNVPFNVDGDINFTGLLFQNGEEFVSSGGDSLPIGIMLPIGTANTDNIPTNWLVCDGREISRTAYADLFAIIGTSYGSGDGLTTFNLPDKRGRVSVGLDTTQDEFKTLGKRGGSKYMQEHNHKHRQWIFNGAGASGTGAHYGFGYQTNTGAGSETLSATTSGEVQYGNYPAGKGDSENLQPYEVDNWIIKAFSMESTVSSRSVVRNEEIESAKDTYSCEYLNDKFEQVGAIKNGDSLPIGTMLSIGTANSDLIPINWLVCDGRAISRTTYKQLFEVIGTAYGEGDGSTTFNIPDKRGRVSVGLDTSQTEFDTLGKKSGAKTHTLNVNQIPSHSHQIGYDRDGAYSAQGLVYTVHSEGVSGANAIAYTGNTGGTQAHNNLQPYEVDNWIIKALPNDPAVSDVLVASLTNTHSERVDRIYNCDYINNYKEDKQLVINYEGTPNAALFIISGLSLPWDCDYEYVITVKGTAQSGFKLSYNSDDDVAQYFQNHIDVTGTSFLPAAYSAVEDAKRIGIIGPSTSFINGVMRRDPNESIIYNNFMCCNSSMSWKRTSWGVQTYTQASNTMKSLKFSIDSGSITYLNVKVYKRSNQI